MRLPNVSELPSLPFSQRRSLPVGSGVYVISDLCGEVLYVGATANLRSRLVSHEKHRRFESFGDVSISWMSVDGDLNNLREVEHAYLTELKPKLNRNNVPLMTEQLQTLCITVPRELKAKLERDAQNSDQTVSRYVRRLLEGIFYERTN